MNDLYIIDTSALVDAKEYYPPDQFIDFWAYLIEMTKKGELIIIDRVADELRRGNDYLSKEFVRSIKIEDTDKEEYLHALSEIMKGLEPYQNIGWQSWIREADPWVIAVAVHIKGISMNPIIIHNEVERKNQLKIESECRKHSIEQGRIHRIIKDKKITFGVVP